MAFDVSKIPFYLEQKQKLSPGHPDHLLKTDHILEIELIRRYFT